MDPTIEFLAQQLIAQDPSISWEIGGINRAVELATMLASQGVTDISGMNISGGWEADPNAGTFIGGAEGGEWVPYDAGSGGYNLTFGDLSLGNLGSSSGINDGTWVTDPNVVLDSEYGGGYGQTYQEFQPGSGYLSTDGKGWDPTAGQYGEIAWSPEGDGNVGYKVVTAADGSLQILPEWGSSSDMDMIGPVLMMAAVAFGAPYLIEAIGGAVGATAAGGGMTAAELAAADLALGGVGGSAGATALSTAMAGGIYSPLAVELGWDIAADGMNLFDLGGNMTGEAAAAVEGWTDAQLAEFGLTRAADGTIAMDSAFSGMPGVTGTPITAGGPVVTPTYGAPISASTPTYTAPTAPGGTPTTTPTTGTPSVPGTPGSGGGSGGGGSGGGGGLWDLLVGGANLWGAYDVYDTVRDMGPKLRDAYYARGEDRKDDFFAHGEDVASRYNTLGTQTAQNYRNLGTDIQGQYNNLGTDMLSRFNTLGQTTADRYTQFGQNYQDQFKNFGQTYENKFGNLAGQYEQKFTDFGEGINSRMAGLGQTYEGKFGALADQAKSAIGTFKPVDISGPLASTSGGNVTLGAAAQGMFDSASTSATRSFDAANQLDLNNLRQQEFDLMQAVMSDQRAQEFSDLESRRQAQGMFGLQSFNQANSFSYNDPNTGQTYTAGADPMMVALMKGRQQADLSAYLQADDNALKRYQGLIGAGTQASSVPLAINAQALQQQQQGYNQGEQEFRSNLSGVQTWLNPAMQGLTTGFTGGMKGLESAYGSGMQGLQSGLQTNVAGLNAGYGAGMEGLRSGYSAGMTGLGNQFQADVSGLNQYGTQTGAGINANLTTNMTGLGSEFQAGLAGVGAFNNAGTTGLTTQSNFDMTGLNAWAGSEWQAANVYANMIEGMLSSLSGAGGGTGGSVGSWVNEVGSDVWDWVTGLFD